MMTAARGRFRQGLLRGQIGLNGVDIAVLLERLGRGPSGS